MATGHSRPPQQDPLDEIDHVNANGQRNPFLLAGLYHLRVAQCRLLRSQQHQVYFLVEFVVLSSDNPSRTVGMEVSWMDNLRLRMGLVHVKRFLSAAHGIDPESPEANVEITAATARAAVSEAQPLAGKEVFAQAADHNITDHVKSYLDVKWTPVRVE